MKGKVDNFCCSLEQSPACTNCSTNCPQYGKCTMCLCYGETCEDCKFDVKGNLGNLKLPRK